jgi:hypothetical protein
MTYPTIEEVEAASLEELATWSRFLESPGMESAKRGDSDTMFRLMLDQQSAIMDRILARFKELGGWTPRLSKHVGW